MDTRLDNSSSEERSGPAPNAVAPTPDVVTPIPETAPAERAPVAPAAIASDDVVPAITDEETLLEDMASNARDSLPSTISDTLTLTDAFFLQRMRIMEYSYVTTAVDAEASAREMRNVVEARAESICLEGRRMFEMGVTLRNSFEDRDGNLFQRVYLLPEDCRQFY